MDATARVLTPDRAQRGPASPVTVDHEYLAAILLELQAANELLAALLAQGEPAALSDADLVQLREHAASGATAGAQLKAALAEPETKRRIKRS